MDNNLAQQIALAHQMFWIFLILVMLMIIEKALVIARLVRRFLGFHGLLNGGDPLDDLTFGQFKSRMDTHENHVASALQQYNSAILDAMVLRHNSIDKQLEIARKKDNTMLIILRDLRAFMVYGKKPASEEIPIEDHN